MAVPETTGKIRVRGRTRDRVRAPAGAAHCQQPPCCTLRDDSATSPTTPALSSRGTHQVIKLARLEGTMGHAHKGGRESAHGLLTGRHHGQSKQTFANRRRTATPSALTAGRTVQHHPAPGCGSAAQQPKPHAASPPALPPGPTLCHVPAAPLTPLPPAPTCARRPGPPAGGSAAPPCRARGCCCAARGSWGAERGAEGEDRADRGRKVDHRHQASSAGMRAAAAWAEGGRVWCPGSSGATAGDGGCFHSHDPIVLPRLLPLTLVHPADTSWFKASAPRPSPMPPAALLTR